MRVWEFLTFERLIVEDSELKEDDFVFAISFGEIFYFRNIFLLILMKYRNWFNLFEQ